jgi:hypothetical protein
MKDKKYLNHLKGDRQEFNIVEVEVRDPDNSFVEMLKYIGDTASGGHSFEVIVDPDMREYRKSFGIDGDGSFYLKTIKVNGRKI